MRSFLSILEKQLLHNIQNLRFALGVISCIIVCMLPTIFYSEGNSYKQSSVLNLFFTGGLEEIAANQPAFCSLAIISKFPYSPWFSMLFIAVCAFPAVSLFADEYYSGMFYFTLPGSSINLYSTAKFAAAGLTGGLVFLLGFGIYATMILLRFPNASEYPPQNLELYYPGAEELTLLLLHITTIAILCASVMMMLAVFLRDRYFLFGLPMLAVFFLDRFWIYIGIRHPEIYEENNGWWMIFDPSSYPDIHSSFQWHTGFPYTCFLLLALTELILFFMIFRKKIEGRVRNNA